jgi:tetratricopeptide (TPR) repeat protein
MLGQAVVLFVMLFLPQAGSEPPKEKEAEYLTATADVHRTHRRFDDAIAVYRQALAIAPGYVPARRGLGNVFDLIGRHADARAEYSAGLERASQFYEDEPLLWALATSYVFERRFDDAHAALQRWADLAVKRRGQSKGGLPMFFELAMAREAFDEAERVLELLYGPVKKPVAMARSQTAEFDVIMTGLEWSQHQSQRAIIAARRGRADEARRLMAEAEAQVAKVDQLLATVAPPAAPNAPRSNAGAESILPAGELAFWLGDTARAIPLLSAEYVKLPRHNLLLGQAYEREQKLAEARAAYTRVVESTLLSIGLAWARPIAQARLAAIGR